MKVTAFTLNYWDSALAVLRLAGPARHTGVELVHGNELEQIWPERVSDGQAVVIQRDFPRHLGAYRQVLERAHQEGKAIFYDLDDLLLELPESHPDHASGYYREAVLPMVQALSEADAVTVSTPALARYLGAFHPRVLLLPNYLDDGLWSLRAPRRPPAGTSPPEGAPLTIGYMGGDSHLPDLAAITPALVRVLKRYAGRVRLHVLGVQPPPALFELPDIDWTPVQSYQYAAFAASFVARETDIFIAPLEDNAFNRCKSAVKFLEYSAAGAAGVYARLEPYQEVVRHGENGYLAGSPEEWEESLCALIESPELRYELALQAQETVRRDGLLSDHAEQWPAAWSLPPDPTAREQFLAQNPPLKRLLGMLRQGQEFEHARQQQFQELSARAREQSERLQQAEARLEVVDAQLQEQSEALIDTTNRLMTANEALLVLYASDSWKLMQALAPPDTRRGRGVGLALRAVRVLKQEGPRPFAAAANRRLRRWLGWPVALPAAPEGEPAPFGVHPVLIRRQFSAEVAALPPRPARGDVIVLPVMNWETRVQRPQHLAQRFAAAGQRVFFGRTTFNVGDGPVLRMVAPGVLEFQLPAPFPAQLARDAFDERLEGPGLEAFAALRTAFGIEEAIVIVDAPFWTPLALRLRSEFGWKVIYDCMDYHPGFSTNRAGSLRDEELLVRESDRVWVTAHRLLEEQSRLNPHCTRIPNGVEFDHFRFPPAQTPRELQKLRRPVIGYYGAIADWFDVDLVRRLALARPGWSFVLIGSTLYADVSPLRGLKNVRLPGEMPYSQIPAALHAFDVAIIPFLKAPLTDATNPVKLFEYLSAGKPVVASDLEELGHYREWVRLASGIPQWLAALEAVLEERGAERAAARIDFARANTWEARFEQVRGSLAGLYPPASVILAAGSPADMQRLSLASLLEKTAYPEYELLVVGPEDAAVDLPGLTGIRRIAAPAGATLFERYQAGAAAAGGDILAFVSDAAVVPRPWLSRLARHLLDGRHLQRAPGGLVGATTQRNLQPGYATWQGLDEFHRHHIDPHTGQSEPASDISPACFAVMRPAWESFRDFSGDWKADLERWRRSCGPTLRARDVFVHTWEEVER